MVNTQHKDSLFSFLFSTPEKARELYAVLTGIELDNDVPITINTLDDVLYKGRINDLSFEVEGKVVVLVEHQSTLNANIALRRLLYIGRLYEKIVSSKYLYGRKPLTIPTPLFYVLYNGVDPCPAHQTLKLSSLFDQSLSAMPQQGIGLELEVQLININDRENADKLKKSQTLIEYNLFIEKIRYFKKQGLSLAEAMNKAVDYSRHHNILEEHLQQLISEEFNMLLTEWNWEEAEKVWREEAREDGLAEGRSQGLSQASNAIARNLLQRGLDSSFICETTGLDLNQVNELKHSLEG